MEAGEYGLTRETCFVASHLEVVAVASLLWISWCVLGGAGFRVCVFFFLRFFFFVKRTQSAASMRPPRLIYLSPNLIYLSTNTSSIEPLHCNGWGMI